MLTSIRLVLKSIPRRYVMAVGLLLGGMLCGSGLPSAMAGPVIYEPVQYQYGPVQPAGHGAVEYFYYGGSHPDAVRHSVRVHYDYLADGPNMQPRNFIEKATRVPLVYSDGVPRDMNLSIYGYTPDDAHNQANANVPRYFQKAALLRAGRHVKGDTIVVAAQAKPIAAPVRRATAPTTRPATQPILIIPKKALQPPASAPQKVALAEAVGGRQ